MGRLLIIIYKNKDVIAREKVKDVDIVTGSEGQNVFFDEYDRNTDKHRELYGRGPEYKWYENRHIPLSNVKKVIYDGVTIWECEK